MFGRASRWSEGKQPGLLLRIMGCTQSYASRALKRRRQVLRSGGCLLLAVAYWFLVASLCLGGEVTFRRHIINADSEFVSAAVFDVNHDGKLDIVSGEYWYEAPTWKKHFLRKVEVSGGRPD